MCETSLVSPAGWIQSICVTTSRRCSTPRLALSLSRALLAAGALALACSSDDGSDSDEPRPPGGQTGEETTGCLPVERANVAWSERSTLGFSADELLNALGSESSERLTWSDG